MPDNKQPRSRKSLEDKQKEELLSLLFKAHQEHPEEMQSYFPELAAKLAEFGTHRNSRSRTEGLRSSYLTERERQFHLDSLKSIVEKFEATGTTSKEEAIKALEDTAALREYSQPFKQKVLGMLQIGLGLSLMPEKDISISFLKGKPVHHTYSLIRGIVLSLTWDGKLIKLELDPRDLRFRQKALSFVGMGADTRSDVAREHDSYLSEILDEQ